MNTFNLWDLLERWPDPVDFGERAVGEALLLEPEDIDFWTGMPLSISYDVRRPD